VFTAPLRINERGANHRKHLSPVVARVSCCLVKIFRLSGVMSQYEKEKEAAELHNHYFL
jgi:hypothetical protein